MPSALQPAGPLRHFLQFKDFTRDEILYVLERARVIKDKFKRYEPHRPMDDRTLAMVFEKASTRTRVSFEAGMYQMGGSVIHLNTTDSQLGRAEPVGGSVHRGRGRARPPLQPRLPVATGRSGGRQKHRARGDPGSDQGV